MAKSSRSPNKGKPATPGNARGNSGTTSTSKSSLYTWGAILLVVIIVCVLVLVKVTGSAGSPTSATGFVATSPTIVNELTDIPLAEFNKIGVTSPATSVSGPTKLIGQPVLTETTSAGTLPEVFYLGAEYCPFCAAQRWGTIIALSRFGTWSGLGNTASYSGDQYPNTPTFTFVKAHYTSKYVAFTSVEEYTNYLNASKSYYALLQNPTAADDTLWKKYDSHTFIPSLPVADNGSIPFLYYGGKYESASSGFTPTLLANQSRSAIAAGLSETASPVTEAIISSANYQSAAICAMTGGKPGSVCNSSGVKAAQKALARAK